MEVRLSAHAERQIAERKLLRETVIAVAQLPEQVVTQTGELPVAQSRIAWRGKSVLLRVVFRDENGVRLVVTAYPTTRVEKYWQVGDEDSI